MVRKKKDEDTEVKNMQQVEEPVFPNLMETSDLSVMFNTMMPMIMMVMMMAITEPTMKGIAGETSDKQLHFPSKPLITFKLGNG